MDEHIVVARSNGAQRWQPVGNWIIVVGYNGENRSGKYGCRRKKRVKVIGCRRKKQVKATDQCKPLPVSLSETLGIECGPL